MRGSDYLLQENKMKAFFTSGNRCRERIVEHFNPGVEIVHVIAKNFNPVNRAEFNPGVESSPCNRPLKLASFSTTVSCAIRAIMRSGYTRFNNHAPTRRDKITLAHNTKTTRL